MTTITVDNTTYQATEGQMATFRNMDKKTLASQVAKREGKGVAFWRALPKETLVVVAAAAEAVTPATVVPAPTPEPEPIVAPVPTAPPAKVLYALLVSEGNYLRRDQPRKPGDTATYKVVPREQASTYARYENAVLKVAEAAAMGQDATVVEL